MPPCRRLAAAIALVVETVLPAAAQDATIDLPGVFAEELEVRVVEIEVVVTDAEGNRVAGLAREDFRLLLDGEEREPDFWSEVREAESWPPRRDPDDERAAVESEPAHTTSYLIFVDDSFSRRRDRDLVLERLTASLEQTLRPGDRAAVVAFDGRELTLLAPWTTSSRVLAGALRDARARRAYGARRESERRLIEITQGGTAGRNLSGLQHTYARRLGLRVERAVMAATAALRTFSAPPGRRVMLLLAGGWPLSPAELAASRAQPDALEDAYREGVLGYDQLYGPLVDTANLLGYTLYPVDVPGTAGEIDPETPMAIVPEQGDRSFFGPMGNLHAGMRYLAEHTGGRAVVNDEREHALAAVADDTRSYYSLGIRLVSTREPLAGERGGGAGGAGASPATANGSAAATDHGASTGGPEPRHELRVEVLRPGLAARARTSFVEMSRPRQMTLATESALLFGTPASANALQLRFGKPGPVRHGRVAVRLEIGLPLDRIAAEAGGDRSSAELALRVATLDEDGARTPPRLETVTVELDPPPAPGAVRWHPVELELERRWHRIVAGVFDRGTGRIYSSSAEIAP